MKKEIKCPRCRRRIQKEDAYCQYCGCHVAEEKRRREKENSKISGTCHCDCAVFRYPACHCSWITEEANTGMERKTTGRMETKQEKCRQMKVTKAKNRTRIRMENSRRIVRM